jgi:hypothetical protein
MARGLVLFVVFCASGEPGDRGNADTGEVMKAIGRVSVTPRSNLRTGASLSTFEHLIG